MHGARFDGKSIKEYGAVMNYARITPPAVKENYIDIPGGDSSIDLTETVGGVSYSDGSIDFKFTLFDFQKKEAMKNFLHGKRMKIILEREPGSFFDGRISCSADTWTGTLYELCFTARVKPYKYEVRETVHTDRVEDEEREIMLVNSRMPVMPKITVDGRISLTYGGRKYSMESGIYQIPEVTLYEGLNRMVLSGKGGIRIEYRKGRLI